MRLDRAVVWAGVAASLAATVIAQPSSSRAFTYQGQLTHGAAPAEGAVDLLFQLYSDAEAGVLLGSQSISGVVLRRGVFTVTLNDQNQFGPTAFDGEPRWLAISVDGVLLTPRQPITATPYALKVAGIDGFSLDAADGSPVDAVYVDNAGRVGVGTTNPTRALHVAAAANPEIRIQDTSGKTFHLGVNSDDDSFRLAESGVADRLVISANGNLGINTLSPNRPLSVRSDGLGGLLSLRNPFDNERWSLGLVGNDLALVESGSGAARVSFSANGNVGIGVATPNQRLSVAGVVESTTGGFRFPDGSVQTAAAPAGAGAWALAGGNIHNTNAGYVGIGVTNPDAPLTVRGVGTGGYDRIMTLRDAGNAQKWEMAVDLGNLWFGSAGGGHLSIQQDGSTGISGDLTVGGSTTTRILHITGGSDIAEPFNVNSDEATERRSDEGAARCGDETSPRGSGDEARNTLVRGSATEVIPGMVVTIDPDRVGELRISRRAYDSTVAGVISGAGGVNAGLMLTQENSVADGQHPVALTGRVWCWCDADAGGAIRAGDLLTTSPTAGHAMKVVDRDRSPGAVLGKAMSSLERGRGLVLVLVNLQ